jgi:hypothetical protein
MDPYLEAHWRDVHASLIIYARDELQASLPGDLRARVEERVFVESAQGVERSVYPDIRVIEHARAGRSTSSATPLATEEGGVAVAEPVLVHLGEEPVSQGYIEIIDAGSGNRVITMIEVLSLANKLPGEGQDLYLKKQHELRQGQVSLVEIDLLRAGKRVLLVPPERLPPSLHTPYQVCVWRSWQPDVAAIYRVPLRERLPIIKIPLRETDPDARLDLQTLIDRCYRNGRYDDLDYTAAPNPPLDPADAAWTDALLREQGRR